MTRSTTPRAGGTPACAVLVALLLVVSGVLFAPVRAVAAPAPPAPTPSVTGYVEPDGLGAGAPGSGGRAPARPTDPAAPSAGGEDATAPATAPATAGAGAGGTAYARVPACPTNAPGEVIRDGLCNNATLTCPDPGAVRYRLYARPAAGAATPWAVRGTQCLTAAQLAGEVVGPAAAPAAVVVTLADFQRVPFAAATSLVAPPGGQALVNLAVHVHAAAVVQVLPTVVQGAEVRVRATPVAYAWDFGDGATTGPSPDPGAAWPAGGHEHAYAVPGARAVTMRTTYTGEFSVAGGPWQPVEGQVTIASPAQPVVVRTARASLVADLLG